MADESLALEGYARNPADPLSVVLLDEESSPITSKTVRADNGDDAWGYFESFVMAPPSYEGLATLRVGDRKPGDGTITGAEVPVFFGVGLDE